MGHARDRFAQGLDPPAVLAEFRILRQEIGRALRERSKGGAGDLFAAELLVHDALDGAAATSVLMVLSATYLAYVHWWVSSTSTPTIRAATQVRSAVAPRSAWQPLKHTKRKGRGCGPNLQRSSIPRVTPF